LFGVAFLMYVVKVGFNGNSLRIESEGSRIL